MQTPISEVSVLTVIISTILLLMFSGVIVYFLFLYQSKRHKYQHEMFELKETYDKTLLESKVEIQEDILNHIARELHANVSHLASLININLTGLLTHGDEETKETVTETKSLAKQLLTELKALCASLNTDHIMHIGFVSALNNELGRLIKLMKYQVKVTKMGNEYRLRPEHEIILFRLCQEILNNIVKYANARSIDVLLDYESDRFRFEIYDDGVGFDIDHALGEAAVKQSTGLLNIKKRAKLINAEVTIESVKDKGTKFSFSIPK
jgi:signal transduction histidine kinase